jgi:hypothetical protein
MSHQEIDELPVARNTCLTYCTAPRKTNGARFPDVEAELSKVLALGYVPPTEFEPNGGNVQ